MSALDPTRQGIRRYKFTVDQLLEIIELGIVPKHTVLLDGDIYDVLPHSDTRIRFTMGVARHIGVTLNEADYFVGVNATLRLSKYDAPSPGLYVLAGGAPKGQVNHERIMLVVEFADDALDYYLTESAGRYARCDVQEFWVVDMKKSVIHVHRNPDDGAYSPPKIFGGDDRVRALLIPELTVVLNQVLDPA